MEQHAVPREVISFSFKLIGFMTLKQFGYLAIAAPFAYIMVLIFPIPYVNYLVALMIMGVGAAFAFFPVNDRPLEVFVRNLYKRLTSPSQYLYKKNNPPLKILSGLYYEADPHIIFAHADSKAKLAAYLATKQKEEVDAEKAQREAQVKSLLQKKPTAQAHVVPGKHPVSTAPAGGSFFHLPHLPGTTPPPPATPQPVPQTGHTNVSTPTTPLQPPSSQGVGATPIPETGHAHVSTSAAAHPYISGTVLNRKKIPLPGILIYIKDVNTQKPLRILKTNPHGIYASFHPLPEGDFLVQVTDPAKNYQFDPVTITLSANPQQNIFTFMSKEMM